jgi:CBS domain-containing protein
MATLTKPLLSRTAGDLMSSDLLLIPRAMSLATAARLLSRSQVSGAPVVDEAGHCVGVLSATDFMHWAERDNRHSATYEGDFHSSWQIEAPEFLPEDAVARHMTADPVTVPLDKTIGELARMMLDAHIHRVIVVDEDNTPLGIVTATDILAAVAYAHDE